MKDRKREQWIEDMAAARVLLAEPMVTTSGDRITAADEDGVRRWTDAKGYAYEYDVVGKDVARDIFSEQVPDLEDRATFLLACDEAERRGVTFLDGGGAAMWGLTRARNLNEWEAPLRPVLIAALARALRDTAPASP